LIFREAKFELRRWQQRKKKTISTNECSLAGERGGMKGVFSREGVHDLIKFMGVHTEDGQANKRGKNNQLSRRKKGEALAIRTGSRSPANAEKGRLVVQGGPRFASSN